MSAKKLFLALLIVVNAFAIVGHGLSLQKSTGTERTASLFDMSIAIATLLILASFWKYA